ncbi:hypothetical protein ACFO9E_34810 [Streptomyces maoxianensis]|uniref:Uncharacterized protein n=1 Tax=Streptomyces maoxianensis TaxID=1459942 RepID=A0ABV9GEZ6_9ACTN
MRSALPGSCPLLQGGEAQVLFDEAGFLREPSQEVGWLALPGAVETDEVGDQIDASGFALDGNPVAAVAIARGCDAGGAGEAVGGLSPLRTGQVPVVGVEPRIKVEDCPPVALGAGGKRMLHKRIFEVGPIGCCPRRLLVVQGVVIQAGPVGDGGVLRQALLR